MDLTRRRRPARHTSELLPRLEDLVRDGVDEPDGRRDPRGESIGFTHRFNWFALDRRTVSASRRARVTPLSDDEPLRYCRPGKADDYQRTPI